MGAESDVRHYWPRVRDTIHPSLRLHTETFTHRNRYTESFYTRKLSHTQKFLHREVFTPRSFYTQKLLHTEATPQRRIYTEELLHNEFLHTHTS